MPPKQNAGSSDRRSASPNRSANSNSPAASSTTAGSQTEGYFSSYALRTWVALSVVLIAVGFQVFFNDGNLPAVLNVGNLLPTPPWQEGQIRLRRAPVPQPSRGDSTQPGNVTCPIDFFTGPPCGKTYRCSTPSGTVGLESFYFKNLRFSPGVYSLIEPKNGEGCLYVQALATSLGSGNVWAAVAIKYGTDTRFIVTLLNRTLAVFPRGANNVGVVKQTTSFVEFKFPDNYQVFVRQGTTGGHLTVDLFTSSRYASNKVGLCSIMLGYEMKPGDYLDLSQKVNLFNNYNENCFETLNEVCRVPVVDFGCSRTCGIAENFQVSTFGGSRGLAVQNTARKDLFKNDRIYITAHPYQSDGRFYVKDATIRYTDCAGKAFEYFVLATRTGELFSSESVKGLLVTRRDDKIFVAVPAIPGMEINFSVFGTGTLGVFYLNIDITIGYNLYNTEICGLCGSWGDFKPQYTGDCAIPASFYDPPPLPPKNPGDYLFNTSGSARTMIEAIMRMDALQDDLRGYFDNECGDKSRQGLQAVFHDAGTWSIDDRIGGMEGSLQFELDRPECEKMTRLIMKYHSFKAKHKMSMADVIAFGGKVAVSLCGGPNIIILPGRVDATTANPPNRFPSRNMTISQIIDRCTNQLGFTPIELVACEGGGHSVAFAEFDIRTLVGGGYYQPPIFNFEKRLCSLDTTPTKLDNQFFKEIQLPQSLLSQLRIGRLTSDQMLFDNPRLQQFYIRFADNQTLFFEMFQKCYQKMVDFGMQDELLSCSTTSGWPEPYFTPFVPPNDGFDDNGCKSGEEWCPSTQTCVSTNQVCPPSGKMSTTTTSTTPSSTKTTTTPSSTSTTTTSTRSSTTTTTRSSTTTTTRSSTSTTTRSSSSTTTTRSTTSTATPNPPPYDPNECEVNFGLAINFNVISFGCFTSKSSIIEGKVAVEQDLTVDSYIIASSMSSAKNGSEVTLVVGGSVSRWTKSQLVYGCAVVGQISLTSVFGPCHVSAGNCVVENENFFEFDNSYRHLVDVSLSLSKKPRTAKRNGPDEYGEMWFSLSHNPNMEIIRLISPSIFIDFVSKIGHFENVASNPTIVFNIPGETTGFSSIYTSCLKGYFVIFNFYEAKTLTIQNTEIYGHILAPNADLTGSSARVYGNVYVKSISGSISFFLSTSRRSNFAHDPVAHYVSCSDGSPCNSPSPGPGEPIATNFFDFKSASPFNVLVLGNFASGASVEGRLAVQGDATFYPGFSVGDQLRDVDRCQDATTIVGGKIAQWFSGQNFFGNIVSGSAGASLFSVLNLGCCALNKPGFFDFNRAGSDLKSLSQSLYQLQINSPTMVAKSVAQYSMLTVTLSGTRSLEIITIQNPSMFLTIVKEITLVNYRANAMLLFNIAGSSSGFDGGYWESLKDIPVIFNFYEATTVRLSRVAVRGTILAPYAQVIAKGGQLYGQLFAGGFVGEFFGISTGPRVALKGIDTKFPTGCGSQTPPPPCDSGFSDCESLRPTCVDLGILQYYNVFVWSTFRGVSYVEGRLASDGDVTLGPGFRVGSGENSSPKCTAAVLVTRGVVKWPSGSNNLGNIVSGRSSPEVSNSVLGSCCVVQNAKYLDFDGAKQKLVAVSNSLASGQSTVSRYDSTRIVLSMAYTIEYILFDKLASCGCGLSGGITFEDFPELTNFIPDTPVVINIKGTSVHAPIRCPESMKKIPVYFNFYEAVSLNLTDALVYGTIIAPLAEITATSSCVYGNVYAKSISGKLDVNKGLVKSWSANQPPKPALTTCTGNGNSDQTQPGPAPSVAPPKASLAESLPVLAFIMVALLMKFAVFGQH